MDFYASGINKPISPWQKNVLFVMVPILINKGVFEPSYNDLKFMVKSFSYFCESVKVLVAQLCVTLQSHGL